MRHPRICPTTFAGARNFAGALTHTPKTPGVPFNDCPRRRETRRVHAPEQHFSIAKPRAKAIRTFVSHAFRAVFRAVSRHVPDGDTMERRIHGDRSHIYCEALARDARGKIFRGRS